MNLAKVYGGKRVLVTGHTGFKGSWLCQWLLGLGAKVSGYALDPLAKSDLFNQLGLSDQLVRDVRADLANVQILDRLISTLRPDFIFHLAAQPLVRFSYETPVETFATNVMGSIHVMEAVRKAGHSCQVVMVTTDKCYENREWLNSYRESDAMGGHDPYSASKGAAEIAIASYRNSFFSAPESEIGIASGRAGNVIGGGDWASDRIVPDCIRAIKIGDAITVRNKTATRPWQHVLEPLSGYLWLGATLAKPALVELPDRSPLMGGFNFGPRLQSNRPVSELVIELLGHTGGDWIDAADPNAPHEASKLNLAIDKAFHLLKWCPVWDFEQTIRYTADWYLGVSDRSSSIEMTKSHIDAYVRAASEAGLNWAA